MSGRQVTYATLAAAHRQQQGAGAAQQQQVSGAAQAVREAHQAMHQVALAQQEAQAQALRATIEAAQAGAPSAPPSPPSLPGEPKVTVNPDGRMTIVSPDGGTTVLYPDGRVTHVRADGEIEQTGVANGSDEGIPQSVQNVIEGFFMTVVFIVVGFPLARAFGRRLDRTGPKGRPVEISPELSERVERIEHAVDSIAVEVERISEGQRFTTKLLTERGEVQAALERPAAATPRKDAIGGMGR
jgi:hypothetical protein